jgi:UrcA family protein
MNTLPNEPAAAEPARVTLPTLPKITIAMIICGILSAAGIGAANAATPGDEPMAVTVHYDPQNIATDAAARALYRQLVSAAEKVCPAAAGSPHLLSPQVRECREQAVARAVYQINNPKLVAFYSTSAKHG